MNPRTPRLFFAALAGAAAALAGTTAQACSLINWNEYADFANRPTPAKVLERSASVDWVRIEDSQPVCGRPPPPEAYDAAEDAAHPDVCGAINEPAPRTLVAVVREHLKGVSPERYELRLPAEARGPYGRFADMRGTDARSQFGSALGLKRDADNRHRSLAFWDQSALGIGGYGTPGMCSPIPAVEPAMSYLVFRDADGAVIAMEPVLYDDDELLRRLRVSAADPAAFGRRDLPVQDYFHHVFEAAVVRIESCRSKDRGYEGEQAFVRLLRGDLGRIESWNDEETVTGPLRRYDFLWDYFEARGEPCRWGTTMLVLRGPIFEDGPIGPDYAWGLTVAPDVPAEWQALIKTPPKVDPDYEPEVYRPVVVRDGRVRTADLQTGMTLTGPETVSIDEVFRWIEEGAPARLAARNAQPIAPGPAERPTPAPAKAADPVPLTLGLVGAVGALGGGAIALWGGRRRSGRPRG